MNVWSEVRGRRCIGSGLAVIFAAVGLLLGISQIGAWGEEEKRATQPPRPRLPAMAPEKLKDFLAQPLVARLATVRPDGRPQVVPMWFIYEDGVVYMSTGVEAAKVRHVRRNNRVAITIDVMEAPLKNKGVIIDGRAEIQTDGVLDVTRRIYKKYMGEEGSATPVAQRSINRPRVVLKITPNKLVSFDTTGG